MGRRYLAVDMVHKAPLVFYSPAIALIEMQKYGPVVRIAPTHVSVAHPDAVGIVYGHSHGESAFHKSRFYDAFVAGTPSVFSTTNRKDHTYKRKIVSQAFSSRALEEFSPFIQTIIATFVSRVDSMCEIGGSIDILTWFNYLTFDVLSFGYSLALIRQY
jgi:benzoate 4-monooxygenase